MIQRQRNTSVTRFVAYLRVSTGKQGDSGLGLEAQERSVNEYVSRVHGRIISTHVEVESGKRQDREKLAAALKLCRLHNATLIIAKLDRLARNVAFISNLMEAKVDFVAVDFPEANRLTVHILAAVAEHEAEMIAARTKSALAAARARGVKLGTPANLSHRDLGTARSIAVRSGYADERSNDVMPIIDHIRTGRSMSLRAIAAELNEQGIPAPRGGSWSATQVSRTLKRHGTGGSK